MKFDVIVAGGGPAGLMAAAAAARAGAKVALVEKGDRLGRKLVISGGGRCNVTNAGTVDWIVSQIPGNGPFMRGPLAQFSNRDIIAFFEGLGVKLKEEDNGRMFPVTDKATTVAGTLIRHLEDLGVTFKLRAPIARLVASGGRVTGVLLASGEVLEAGAVVVAVGGKSVPATGSTGDGYGWAKALGHTITPLFPTEVPIVLAAPWVSGRALMGLSLKDAALTLLDAKGKVIVTQRGDAVFTHFGISGPAALRLGHYVSKARLKQPDAALTLRVDPSPDLPLDALVAALKQQGASAPKRALRNLLGERFPERWAAVALERSGFDGDLTHPHWPRALPGELALALKRLEASVRGTRSIEEAFVTGGGVSLKELDAKTLGSKLASGLYFAGEVLDVHAHTGGYNITIAFSTGAVAGTAAARHALAP